MLKLFFCPPKPIASGHRIYVRAPWKGDRSIWLNARRKSYDFLQPWEPLWQHDALSNTGFKRWLDHVQTSALRKTDVALLVFSKSTHNLLGGITIKDIRWGAARNAGLGYWMHVDHAGKGYMAEAIACVGLYCFEELGLNRIEAACLPRNKRSGNLLKKLLFIFEGNIRQLFFINGVWENHDLYAMLAKDRFLLTAVLKNNKRQEHW